MRGRKFYLPHIFYSAIDPGGGGGGGQGGQVPGSPTPNAQPGSQGVGQGGGFREQFYPNVPDEVWAQMEPHVRRTQEHVTQLEQRYAPFKSYDAESLQGLAGFAQAFDRDPLGQWMRMAHGLQQAGVLDSELDLEHLESIIRNTVPEPQPNGQPEPNGDMPPWARDLIGRLDKLEGGVTQFQTDQRTQVENAVLNRQVNRIKGALEKAGVPKGSVSDEMVLSTYIAFRGNAQAAAEALTGMRTSWLKGFVQDPNPNPNPNPTPANKDLDLPNGAPQARVPRGRGGRRGGVIDGQTAAAAAQFLKTQGGE